MTADLPPEALALWPADLAGHPLVIWGSTPELVASEQAGYVYLATPYSREVVEDGRWSMERSFELSTRAAWHVAQLARLGLAAVSPIVLSAEACHATMHGEAPLDPLDHGRWMTWCAPILRGAAAVVVPAIDGWQRSAGIGQEVRAALRRNTRVYVYGRVG